MQKGQALLIVLLSMAVILTMILSIMSRSITDIAVTSREEEALRAFSAAEAGVERALTQSTVGDTFSGDVSETANFEGEISDLAEGETSFAYPIDINVGDVATIWFVSHDATGGFVCGGENPCFTGSSATFCWGKEGTAAGEATTPALEVSIFYTTTPGNLGTTRIARAVFDPNSSRRATNAFSGPTGSSCSAGEKNFAFSASSDFGSLGIPAAVFSTPQGLLMARVRMLYNANLGQSLGINIPGGSVLPAQGDQISSTGSSGEATRRLEVHKLFADALPIFDSVLFTPGSISK